MSAAAEGKLEQGAERTLDYLIKIVGDKKRDDAVRLQAANVLLPYVKPRLASIEQTVHTADDTLTDEQIAAKLQALIEAHPDLLQRLLAMQAKANPGIAQQIVNAAQRNQPRQTPLESDNVIPLQGSELH